MEKQIVTPQMAAGRIGSHGTQITDLSEGFSLKGGQFFSLFIWPKSDGVDPNARAVSVNCKLFQDDTFNPCPHTTFCWGEPAVSEIAPGGIDTTKYDVFWGCAFDVPES